MYENSSNKRKWEIHEDRDVTFVIINRRGFYRTLAGFRFCDITIIAVLSKVMLGLFCNRFRIPKQKTSV